MRELRVLGALFVAGMLTLLAAGGAAGQTACAPSTAACNAPGATPLPSIPVVVGSPAHSSQTSSDPLDVLSRPPARATASVMPALAVLCGVGMLMMTLGSIARRRRPSARTAAPPARRVLVHAETVRTVTRERWDIEAVERAAAGLDRT